jgi:hypothetical protein
LFIGNIFADLKTSEIGPNQFSKTFGAEPKNLLSKGNERFKLTGFQKLWAN